MAHLGWVVSSHISLHSSRHLWCHKTPRARAIAWGCIEKSLAHWPINQHRSGWPQSVGRRVWRSCACVLLACSYGELQCQLVWVASAQGWLIGYLFCRLRSLGDVVLSMVCFSSNAINPGVWDWPQVSLNSSTNCAEEPDVKKAMESHSAGHF